MKSCSKTNVQKLLSERFSTCCLVLIVIVKLCFSAFLKLRSRIITHPSVSNNGAPSNFWKPLKYTVYTSMTPKNVPQTSNSPLLPTKSIVTKINQW